MSSTAEHAGPWQRDVPVFREPLFTPMFWFLCALTGVAGVLGFVRFFSDLATFSAMTDDFAWGVWKTFNVMTLTALGSGGLAVGIAAWVLNRKRLHVVLRTAVVTSFFFYLSGLIGIMVDVGRPWNFFNAALPWRWNTHSALFEVSIAMPIYCLAFLFFEQVPIFLERFHYFGNLKQRVWVKKAYPIVRKLYPWMVAGAYLVPMGHQSSLGALMLLAGPKVHPLWQSQLLPFLYLIQAAICGFGFIIVILMVSCWVWKRPLDMGVLGELASMASWTVFFWLVVRFADLIFRGNLHLAFSTEPLALFFWMENFLILVPALIFRNERMRLVPRVVFQMAFLMAVGGTLYRFVPTTIAYDPGSNALYFPNLPEVLITMGLVALVGVGYLLMVKLFAILPAPMTEWNNMVAWARTTYPNIARDDYGNPVDD
jgi:Ni/Fe-hydrogenase subunit HybB-like protein